MDDTLLTRMTIDHAVRLLRDDFNFGGHRYPDLKTDGEVTQSFVGRIKDVKLSGNRINGSFDILEEMWKKPFPGNLWLLVVVNLIHF